MQKQNINERSESLIGVEAIKKLADKKIAVVGLGGVGSIIPLALAMSNIKKMILIDFDVVSYSNLNRQIAYNLNDINKIKSIALKEKLLLIREDLDIISLNSKINSDFNFSLFDDCDYVIDCIDDIKAKVLLIKYCVNNNIKIISSLGMGNKLDPSLIKITPLNKTTIDPLAKKLRYMLKKEKVDISKVLTAFSYEQSIIKERVISSMVFVPNAAGLLISSFVVKELIK